MIRLMTDPVIPVWLVLLAVGMAAAFIWITVRRCAPSPHHKVAIAGLRLVTVIVLAALLLQPTLLRVRKQAEPPTLAVLVDISASMLDSPNAVDDIRASNLKGLLRSRTFRNDISKYKVRWYAFGARVEEIDDPEEYEWRFNAPRSHILDALNTVAERNRASNLAGIVLLTDGLDQSTVQLDTDAARIPVYIPELEKEEPQREAPDPDVYIANVDHPKLLVSGWEGQIDVLIKRTQDQQQQLVPVHLYRDNERLRQATASFDPGQGVRQITFTIQPQEVGRQSYRVEIQPPTDSDPGNNSRAFVIDVTDPKNRILYLEGTPRFEFKYIKRAMLKERGYQISAFLQSAPGVFINFSETDGRAEVGGLPELTEADALKFRAIILGDMQASALTREQQGALVDYVDKGGGLLFWGGARAYGAEGWPSSETMAKLLPFTNREGAHMRDGRFAATVTPVGQAHPVLRGVSETGELPQVLSLWGPVEIGGGAQILARTLDEQPVLIVNRYGSGKVAAVLTDSTWRWQLAAPRLTEGKSLHERFVTQLIHWLSPQKQEIEETANLQLVTAGGEAELRDNVVVGAVLGEAAAEVDAKLKCAITLPDERVLELPMQPATLGEELGLTTPVKGYRADFVPQEPGEYRIEITEAMSGDRVTGRVLVIEPQLEKTGRQIDRDWMRTLAQRTGGAYVAIDDAEEIAADIPFKPRETTVTNERPIWNRGWILILLILLFAGEWYLRNKLDMV